jgi:acetyltransferase
MTQKEGWASTLTTLREAGIPVFDFPETGTRALGAMVRYGRLSGRPEEAPPSFDDIDEDAASEVIDEAQADGREHLTQAAGFRLLASYGIAVPAAREVASAAEAAAAADEIGYPVVLKVESEAVIHKSDEGGVVTGLGDRPTLTGAFEAMSRRFERLDPRFVVARQAARDGLELIFGASREEGLGHLVIFGLGGVLVEVLEDVAFGIAPLSRSRALEMIRGIRGRPVLDGVRGLPPVDIEALTELLCRLSRLVADHPRIAELDLNPVLAYPGGIPPVAVDVRVRIDRS